MATSGKNTKIVGDTEKRKPPRAGMGRPKGAENKITKSLKEALLSSFESLGGEAWLVALAQSDPKAYASLLARLIPSESSLKVDNQPLFEFVNALPLHPPEDLEPLSPAL